MHLMIITLIFIFGYLAIAFEHKIRINKAATAILTGVIVWTVFIVWNSNKEAISNLVIEHLGNISGILFFLLGAMTIVEIIDAHDGFEIITKRISSADKRRLLWVISILTFFLSAVLDNLQPPL